MSRDIYLGLGSNLGDREAYLRRAISEIEAAGLELLAMSGIENTKALIVTEQPDFLNCVIRVRGDIAAQDLLVCVKNIERSIGRVFRYEKGPREIDIDILLYGDECVNNADLVIPHPGITQRAFVLRQLLQIDPALKEPGSGRQYESYFQDYYN